VSWSRGANFRAIGYVERTFVPPSGKCAFLTLSVPGRSSDQKLDLVAFDDALIVIVGALGKGQTCQVRGNIGSQCLKNKAREDVQVDGRSVWMSRLEITSVDVEGAKDKPAPAGTPRGADPAADKREDSVDW
jgi:hypothetical protein